jgi:hypothetical protein
MKWEYKTVNVMPKLKMTNKSFDKELKVIDQILAQAGQEGWEPVSNTAYDWGTKFYLIFKRPIEE